MAPCRPPPRECCVGIPGVSGLNHWALEAINAALPHILDALKAQADSDHRDGVLDGKDLITIRAWLSLVEDGIG